MRAAAQNYGKDLVTGAPLEPTEYRAMNPEGRAILKAAEYLPPHEPPGGEYPYALITGRTLFQFHTRTKTGRAPQLQAAAPEVWVEMSVGDAGRHGFSEGDLAEVSSPRGSVRARVRISGIREGVLFVPFHYGYWDTPAEQNDHHRAANELTEVGQRYGQSLKDNHAEDSGLMSTARGKASELVGRRPEPTALLLTDLRHLHRVAAGVSLDWELLAQGAQGAKDAELLALTRRCHPQTLRQMRWTNAMLKILSPQFLAS